MRENFNIVYQVPIIRNNHCKICNQNITEEKVCNIAIYNKYQQNTGTIKHKLAWCSKCSLPYATKEVFSHLGDIYSGHRALGFNTDGKWSSSILKARTFYLPPEKNVPTKRNVEPSSEESIRQSRKKKNQSSIYAEVIENKRFIKQHYSPIYITNYALNSCPKCAGEIKEYVEYLSLSGNRYLRVPGKICFTCEMMFDDKGDFLISALNEYGVNTDNFLDKNYYIPNLPHKTKSCRVDGNILTVFLKKTNSHEHRTISIVSNIEQQSPNLDIYYYAHFAVRSLWLSLLENDHTTDINGEKYEILLKKYSNNMHSPKDFEFISPPIGLGLYGGDFNYSTDTLKEKFFLFYSPYKDSIIAETAFYNSRTKEYRIDAKRFRELVYQYGNPGIKVYPTDYQTNQDIYDIFDPVMEDKLKGESLPHAWGYNLSSRANKSDEHRQKLLKEILDLKLMRKSNLINLLVSLINNHKSDKYEHARYKWTLDLEFVKEYHPNYERFGKPKIF